MPKTTKENLKNLGFTCEMYAVNAAGFDDILDDVIDEQSALLSARVGAGVYASNTEPYPTYLAKAEKLYCAAELVNRRIVSILTNAVPNGDEPNTTSLGKLESSYRDRANKQVDLIGSGAAVANSGFSSGVSVSSHFVEDD